MDALHLVQTDLVDLVGGQFGGGRELQAGVVIGLALGQAPHAAVAVRHGRRLLLHLGQRRQHGLVAALPLAGQGCAAVGQQPVLRRLIGLQRADLALEVGPDRIIRAAVEGRAGDDVAGVGDRRLEHEVRRDDARRRALPQLVRDLAHDPFRGADAGHIGLGVADAADPVVVDQEDRQTGCRIAVRRELEAPVPPAVRQPRLLHPVLEQPHRHSAFGADGRRIKLRFHLRQLALRQGQRPFGRRIGGVVQLVVVGLDAQRGHCLRRQGDPRLPRLLEEGRQSGVLGLDRHIRRRRGGALGQSRRGRARDNGGDTGGGDQQATHGQPSGKRGRDLHRSEDDAQAGCAGPEPPG